MVHCIKREEKLTTKPIVLEDSTSTLKEEENSSRDILSLLAVGRKKYRCTKMD